MAFMVVVFLSVSDAICAETVTAGWRAVTTCFSRWR